MQNIWYFYLIIKLKTVGKPQNWGRAVYLSDWKSVSCVLPYGVGNQLSLSSWLETGFDLSVETDRVTVRAQGQNYIYAKCLIFLPKSNWNWPVGEPRQKAGLSENMCSAGTATRGDWLWPDDWLIVRAQGQNIYAKYLIFLPKSNWNQLSK